MKIIIDIPEELYKKWSCSHPANNTYPEWYIMHGTPLPKGHGRLIDADAIKPIKAPIAPLTPDDAVHYEWVYIKSRIDQTPTIIEADKEGEWK